MVDLQAGLAPSHAPAQWLLGRHPTVRNGVKDVLQAILTYVVASVLLGVATSRGLIPFWKVGVLISFFVVSWGTVYALVRSAWSQRLVDPQLAFVRIQIDMLAIVMSYGLITMVRGSTLQWLCLMLTFYLGRLSQRQIFTTAFIAIGLLAATLLGHWMLRPQDVVLHAEVLNLSMLGVLLPIAAFIGGEVHRLFQRAAEQGERLQYTLKDLTQLSTQDGLTGLCNRHHMLELLEEEPKRQRRSGQAFCVALLDIDFFKLVNDTHGHAMGDQVLKKFAQLAADSIGSADTLARWGGEEFLLLLPATNLDQAQATMARLHEVMRQYDWGQHAAGLRLTFSAGLAEHVHPEAPLSALLERVDQALYRAKQTGRDRTQLALAGSMAMASASAACAKPHVDLATPVKLKQPAPSLAAGAVLSHEAALQGPGPTDYPVRGLLGAIVNAVMGSDSAMRERLRLMMAGILGYASWIATIGLYAIPYGVISPGVGQLLMVYVVLTVAVFYVLIRSGYSTRWQDQQIILPQLLNACVACVACYWVAPALRPIVLQSMCVLLIFGMVTLKPRAALLIGGLFTVMLLATMGLQYSLPHPGIDLTTDALKVALSCFIFLHLSTLSFSYSKLRQSVASEQARLEQAVQQVHELLIHDALTGLFNRKYLVELLERERQRFTRSHSHFCVALIDLDHFKRINDSHGHHVGDEVLVEFGRMARSVLRETDVIGRWGGEEFLVVMPDTEPGPNGIVTLERLHQRFATLRIQSCPELRVAFSSGVAEFRVDESLDQTMERADRALYAAKAEGRNRCVLAP